MSFQISSWVRGWPQRLWWLRNKRRLAGCGTAVRLPRTGTYTFETLHLGNHVQIGGRAIFWAVHSQIIIKDKVLTGPEVIIMAGNHNISLQGKFMYDVGDDAKRPEDDKDVVIEEDVWVGARAIILRGVCIGRGAVIGAGAVVTKTVPPYGIVAGNPARPVRLRGTIQEIIEHEKSLYPSRDRLTVQVLEAAAALVANSPSARPAAVPEAASTRRFV